MKVYGGALFAFGEQIRVVIASRSINQVAKRIGETYYRVNKYWGATGNEIEIKKALDNPNNPIVVGCLSRNENNYTILEFQSVIDRYCKPKEHTRPYIKIHFQPKGIK